MPHAEHCQPCHGWPTVPALSPLPRHRGSRSREPSGALRSGPVGSGDRTDAKRPHAQSGHCDPASGPSLGLSPLTVPRVGHTQSLASRHQGGAGSGPAQERGVSASLRDPMALTTVVSCRPMRYQPGLRVARSHNVHVPHAVDAGIADPAMIRGPPARPTTTPEWVHPPGTMDHRRSSPNGHERHDNAVHTRKSRAHCRWSRSRATARSAESSAGAETGRPQED